MSFLNPVNEPVLMFSSTDASAPQINYNSRVAGDIKAVLKACLVTGYGTKDSAGWSIVNEVGNVAEFVSPSAAMNDYRLGIDDATASSSTWYYQYQNARTDPAYNAPSKTISNIDKTSLENGWRLLVTDRGIILVEIVKYSPAGKLSSRITYWGGLKSALSSSLGKNICFFNIGHSATTPFIFQFYTTSDYIHINLAEHIKGFVTASTGLALSSSPYVKDNSVVDLVSPIYIASNAKNQLIAGLPPLLSKIVNKSADCYGVVESILDNRNVLEVCAGYTDADLTRSIERSATFLIRTDYWEY